MLYTEGEGQLLYSSIALYTEGEDQVTYNSIVLLVARIIEYR